MATTEDTKIRRKRKEGDDTYVKQDGKWLIKKRESDFMFTTVEDMPK